MFQPDILAYLDAIRQQYETLVAENKSLKQENLRLAEANSQYVRKMQYYMSMFSRQKHPLEPSPHSPSRHAKCLKRGSDWFVDGDKLFAVSMRNKIMMGSKITNAVVSRCGRYIAFGCGYRGFVLKEGEIYFLNPGSERMERYNSRVFDKDMPEYKICPMDFTPDSMFLYVADEVGVVRIWNMDKGALEDSFKSFDVIALKAMGSLVFTIGWDKTLKVYSGTRQVACLSSGEEFSGPMVVSSNGDFVHAVVGNSKILTFNMKTESSYLTSTNEERILAIAVSPENMLLSVGGYGRMAEIYKMRPEKSTSRLHDTIEQKTGILALGFTDGSLVVGQHEGFMVWDLKQKKSMRVQISESNVVGISACEDCLTTIDNNGVLRVWGCRPAEQA